MGDRRRIEDVGCRRFTPDITGWWRGNDFGVELGPAYYLALATSSFSEMQQRLTLR